MKKIIVLVVTLLLSFTLLTSKTYALSTYDRLGFGEVRYTDTIDNFQGNSNLFAMKLEIQYYYTPSIYWTTDFQQAMLEVNEDDKYDYFSYIVRSSVLYIYQDGQPQGFINDVYNIMWVKNLEGVSGNLLFMSLSGVNLANYDVDEMGELEIYLVQDRTGSSEPYWEGYYDGQRDYGYYDGSNYIPADDYGLDRYNAGLNENREYFGIDYNGNWLTAEQYGDIQFDDGYGKGLNNEIDWFTWSTTFFLMPFRILNIEILPGVRIGYFALFSLLIGVVGWFFFIVGKGGGRRK